MQASNMLLGTRGVSRSLRTCVVRNSGRISSLRYSSSATATATSPTPPSISEQPQQHDDGMDNIDRELVKIRFAETAPCRLQTYYDTTLAPALLYLTYDHKLVTNPPPPATEQIRHWNPSNPYAKNRPQRGGSSPLVPPARAVTGDNVIKLEKVVVSTFVPEINTQKEATFGAMMAIQAITGQSEHTRYIRLNNKLNVPNKGIELIRTGAASAKHKVRPGRYMGAKTTLKGVPMYNFCEVLAEFVLPRLPNWEGIELPPPNKQPSYTASGTMSGSIDFRLPKEAMPLFPQIDINRDSYSRNVELVVNFVTNARGAGSTERARALLSGLMRFPFVRS